MAKARTPRIINIYGPSQLGKAGKYLREQGFKHALMEQRWEFRGEADDDFGLQIEKYIEDNFDIQITIDDTQEGT